MTSLANEKCEACRVGAPVLTEDEIVEALSELQGWRLMNAEGINQLQKVYEFDDFIGAQRFLNRVAELAEEEGHHPALLLEWGKVTVNWWTHKIKGLHKNDAIMAAKTDELI